MDCFPCSVAKRRVELELTQERMPLEEVVKRVSATRCAMCTEADRQEAVRARRARGAARSE
jgi:hypothetical protein